MDDFQRLKAEVKANFELTWGLLKSQGGRQEATEAKLAEIDLRFEALSQIQTETTGRLALVEDQVPRVVGAMQSAFDSMQTAIDFMTNARRSWAQSQREMEDFGRGLHGVRSKLESFQSQVETLRSEMNEIRAEYREVSADNKMLARQLKKLQSSMDNALRALEPLIPGTLAYELNRLEARVAELEKRPPAA